MVAIINDYLAIGRNAANRLNRSCILDKANLLEISEHYCKALNFMRFKFGGI